MKTPTPSLRAVSRDFWTALLFAASSSCSIFSGGVIAAPSGSSRLRSSALFNLTSDLFDAGYNPSVRPVLNASLPVNVSFGFSVQRLGGLDIKEQQLRMTVVFEVQWKDQFLVWNPDDYEGIEWIFVKQEHIWLPDLSVSEATGDVAFSLGYKNLLVIVGSDGHVMWIPKLDLSTQCAADITFYPYDTQLCHWTVVPWVLGIREQIFELPAFDSQHTDDLLNAEWEVVQTFRKVSTPYPDHPLHKVIRYSFSLRRRPLFLTMTLVTPTLLLALLSTSVFWLPAESGEKVSLGVTLMLTFTFLLATLTDVLPGSSLQTSITVLFLVFLCACSALSVLLTVLVLSLYHRPDSLPLTRTARVFVRCVWAVRCSAVPVLNHQTVEPNPPATFGVMVKEDIKPNLRPDVNKLQEETASFRNNSQDKAPGREQTEGFTRRSPEVFPQGSSEVTWRAVAECCDYVFSRLFLLVVVGSSSAFFLYMKFGQ